MVEYKKKHNSNIKEISPLLQLCQNVPFVQDTKKNPLNKSH